MGSHLRSYLTDRWEICSLAAKSPRVPSGFCWPVSSVYQSCFVSLLVLLYLVIQPIHSNFDGKWDLKLAVGRYILEISLLDLYLDCELDRPLNEIKLT